MENQVSLSEYINNTNVILSKNIALECLTDKFIESPEDKSGDIPESIFCLINDQNEDIQKLRHSDDDNVVRILNKVLAKNLGLEAMIEKIMEEGDLDGDIKEAILTLTKNQRIDINKLITHFSMNS